jgi:hypothetical protein
MGRTGLGTLLRDFFRGTEAALVDALRRDRIEVCIPRSEVAVRVEWNSVSLDGAPFQPRQKRCSIA